MLELMLSLIGDGGHAYLKEWMWWAGLISSKLFVCYRFYNHYIKCQFNSKLKVLALWAKQKWSGEEDQVARSSA